jgi:hypothetical protein
LLLRDDQLSSFLQGIFSLSLFRRARFSCPSFLNEGVMHDKNVVEKTKEEILLELKAISANIRKRQETVFNNNVAKRLLADEASKKTTLIYRLARTFGYPEDDVVAASQKISSWLKFGKLSGLPHNVSIQKNHDYLESWCFYLKGFEHIHGIVVLDNETEQNKIVEIIFFLHGEPEA